MGQPRLSFELAQQAVKTFEQFNHSATRAAAALKIPRGTLQQRLRAAALQGLEPKPATPALPPGVHGTSTLYDGDGKPILQWVKAKHGKTPEELAEWVKQAFEDVDRVPKIAKPAAGLNKDLLTVYPIGDHHVAMYAWGEEVGADYDIKIAENLLVSAMTHLVDKSPPSERALIVNVGDFFHVDNLKNETSRSGHTLDVDTRYAAMIRAGTRMLRTAIDQALSKHRHVTVVNEIGNHDDIGSLWLSQALAMMYEENPRVTIDTSPGKFHYYRHGKVLIGTTHGDTGKPEKLQGVMAADRPEDWGATKYRHWITGHVHNRGVIEFPGVVWETFRTLAPADAWAYGQGYRSGRDMTSIVFHAEHGEIGRHAFKISMLKD
jgi:hypothetical protein